MDQMTNQQQQDRGPGRAIVQDDRRGGVPDEYRRDAQPYPSYSNDFDVPEATGFDFYKYLRVAVKYRWLIVGTTFIALLLATVITFLTTPIYRATASLQIDREAINVTGNDGVQPRESGQGVEFFQTQYELLASRSLTERVVSTLGLAEDPTYNVKQAPSLAAVIKTFIFGQPEQDPAAEDIESKTRKTTNTLQRLLTVAPVRGSRVVKISIDHPSAAVAQKVVNGFAEVFIADNLDRRYDASSYARKFLEERIQQLKVKLADTEKQLVQYAEEQGIITLDANKSLAAVDLEAINTRLSEARTERVKLEQLWNQAQSTQGFGLQQILDSEAIQSNRKLRTELAADYQQKLGLYKPAFPLMVQLRNQIKELDRQVQSEVQAIKDSIQSQYEGAKAQEDELASQLETTKASVVDQRNRSIQYNIIQREVDTNRTLYDGLLQRYKEIGVSGAVGTNNISIVDRAQLPQIARTPNLGLNLGLALVAGLLVGILAALGLDYIDDSFKAPEDIEREIGLSVIGVVPKPKVGAKIENELADPRSAIAEAIRSLRTGMQFATSDGLPKTLLVTSSKPSEGKTTTTIALAQSLAHIGLNVLLIDGDLRNASVHKRLFCSNELGLSNYLTGAKMPEDVVQGTNTPGLVLMASGPLPPNPAELLAGPKLLSLLTLARESFDIVLIDGPPVMGLADAPLLSSMTHATLLVVAANETRRSVVKVALKRLQFARANIIGALLSKFDSSQTGYGYGYGYGDYEYHSYGVKALPSQKG
jgi:polysaccharide biosynthesis transport protein